MNNSEQSSETETDTKKGDDVGAHVVTSINRFIGRYSLQAVISASFIIIVVLAIGITGLLSFQNSQYAVHELAVQLLNEESDRIVDKLDVYLELPHLINQLSQDHILLGQVDIHDNEGLKKYLQAVSYRFDTVEAVCFANSEDGNYSIISKVGEPGIANGSERFYGVSNINTNYSFDEYRIDRDGSALEKTLSLPGYDPRTRPWYRAAVDAKGPAWTPVYMWLEGVVSVDAVAPVYSKTGELLGVLDTALTLNGIGEFLQNLKVSEHGQAFIIEKSGLIIASSTIKEPYKRVNGKLVRMSVFDCNDSVVHRTSHYIEYHLGNQTDITAPQRFSCEFEGEQQLVQVTPYQGTYDLGWLIVVVIPESDFMGAVNKSNQTTAIILISAIIGTIIVCILLARYITKPIVALNRSARALASGDFDSWTDPGRHDELGQLSHSFKQMADQLWVLFSSLKSSEKRYMALFQSSADAIMLFDADVLIEMNLAAEAMFSMAQGTSAGKKAEELFGSMGTFIREMIASSPVMPDLGYQSQTITRMKDGTEQFLNVHVSKVTLEEKILSLVYVRDITAERKAIIVATEQEALRESFARISMILQFLPDPTFVIDTDGTVLFWNRAMERETGIPSQEMTGTGNYSYSKEIYQFERPVLIDLALHPETPSEALYPSLERVGDLVKASFWVSDSGERRFISAIAAPLYDANGKVTGAIESARDITPHKITEEALLIANKKLNLLSGITRHDILNKVMASKAYLLLLSEYELNAEQKLYLDGATRSIQDIEHFVKFSRTYQDLGSKAPEWQNVSTLFSHAARQTDIGNIAVAIDLSGIFIQVDPLFETICYTLIENAVRHGESLTRIDITAQSTDSVLVISVEDDGIGIPEDEKEIIFERGYGKNTGLGLFFSREILSISDITIAETGLPGKGCRFEITIPKGRFRIDA